MGPVGSGEPHGVDNLRREVINQLGPLQSYHLIGRRKGAVSLARKAMTTVMKSHQAMERKKAALNTSLAALRAFIRS
jgi:hypothetical protein